MQLRQRSCGKDADHLQVHVLFSAIGEGSLRFHVFVALFSKCRAAPDGRAKALNGLLQKAHEVELPKAQFIPGAMS